MLETQSIDLEFRSGADHKTTDKNVVATQFRDLQNFRIDKLGAVVPRGAFVGIANSYDAARAYQGFDMASSETRLAYCTNNKIYSIAPSAGTVTETAAALRGALSRVYGGEMKNNQIRIAASSTQVCMVWVPPSPPYTADVMGVLILDAASNEVVLQTVASLATIDEFQLVCVNDTFYVIYSDSSFDLKAAKVSSSGTTFTAVTWASSPTGTTNMQFAAAVKGSTVYLHYVADSNSTTNLQRITASGTTFTVAGTSSTVLTFASVPTMIAIAPVTSMVGADVACFGMLAASSVRGTFYDSAGARVSTERSNSLSAGVTATRCWAFDQSGGPRFGFQYLTSANNMVIYRYEITLAGAALELSNSAISAYVVAGPVSVEGRALLVADANTEPTYGSQAVLMENYLYDTPKGEHLARLGVGMNYGQSITGSDLQVSSGVVCASKYFFAVPAVTSLAGIESPAASAAISKVNLTPILQATVCVYDPSYQNVSVFDTTNGQNNYLGVQNRLLDTTNQAAGVWPEVSIFSTYCLSKVAGGLTGVYSWVFAKLYKSSSGQEYRVYSPIFTSDLAAQKLQVVVSSSEFAGATTFEIYRTEANGSIFYLAKSVFGSGTYTDDITDANLIKTRLADINGNELAPEGTPAAKLACYYGDRLAIVTCDNENEVWFNRPGAYPAGTSFSTGLKLVVPTDGGPITGIATLSQSLMVMKQAKILEVYGDPAGVTGEGSTLGNLRTLYDGIGCVAPRSVVGVRNGLVFQSAEGFYLLSSVNKQLQFIGAGPYDFKAVPVTGSAVVPGTNEVLFTYSNNYCWVLNLDTGAWYQWQAQGPLYGATANKGGVYLAQTETATKYNTSVSQDTVGATSYDIPQTLTTGWIRLNGIADYQRVKRLLLQMTVLEACVVTIKVYTDYQATEVQTVTIDTSTLNSALPPEIDIHLAVQKCEAMSFKITTSKYGINLEGATLIIGAKQGRDKSRSTPNRY